MLFRRSIYRRAGTKLGIGERCGMTTVPLVILADDLTGASDAALPFAELGAETTVRLDRPHGDAWSEVVAIDLDTRALPPAVAAERIGSLLRELPPQARLLKKIDSTLRGNIAAELDVLRSARAGAIAIVVPAHPRLGREQRDGMLFLDGTPVDATAFGQDLFAPARESDVRRHLPEGAIVLGAPSVLGGSFENAFTRAVGDGARVVTIDARNEEDLRAIAELATHDDSYLWAGSAGLFEALAPRLWRGAAGSAAAATVPTPVDLRSPVLLAIGSLSAMTRLQIGRFAAAGGVTVMVDPRTILIDEGGSRAHALTRNVERALGDGRDVLVALSSDREDVEAALSMGRLHGFDVPSTSRELRERFVEVVMPALAKAGTVVLSGADVARTFLQAAGIHGFRLIGEAAPDIPLARALERDVLLVPKGGSAGTPETYRAIVARTASTARG